jgi:hypothetical protein
MRYETISGWVKLAALLATVIGGSFVLPPKVGIVVDSIAVALAAADRRISEQLRNKEPERK